MSIDTSQLLRQLGLSGRVGLNGLAGGGEGSQAAGSLAHASFADLLKQAREGTLSSALPVTNDAAESVALSDDQLARLSLAADRAEAAGVRSALVRIDGQELILDVHNRRVTGLASSNDGVIAGVDGVLDLGDARVAAGAGSGSTGRVGTNTSIENRTLAELLARLTNAGDA